MKANLLPKLHHVVLIVIIAVPTPFSEVNQSIPHPDISYVLQAVNSILPYLRPGNILIIESTCPVGTTKKVADLIFTNSSLTEDELHIAYCPERVIPGSVLSELVGNDRVVGGFTPEASLSVSDFYRSFCKGNISTTSSSCAELVKLTENSYRCQYSFCE